MLVGVKSKKKARYYCQDNNNLCKNFFIPYSDRRDRENSNLARTFGDGVKSLPLEIRQKWAFVRLTKAMTKGFCTENEFDNISHHINNGHTFMAFFKIKKSNKGEDDESSD